VLYYDPNIRQLSREYISFVLRTPNLRICGKHGGLNTSYVLNPDTIGFRFCGIGGESGD
jgi:hypothetical protein